MATDVTLIDGPRDGDVVSVPAPWPRRQLVVDVGSSTAIYWVNSGTTTATYAADAGNLPGEDPLFATTGPPGDPGPPGPTGGIGPEGPPGHDFIPQGDWQVDSIYGPWDVVFYNESSYFVGPNRLPPAGTLPTDTTYWYELAGGIASTFTWRGVWDDTIEYIQGNAVTLGTDSIIYQGGSLPWPVGLDPFGTPPGLDYGTWEKFALYLAPPGGTEGAMVFMGDWDVTVAYISGATVEHAGATWVAVADNTGVEPALGVGEWVALSSTGAEGGGGGNLLSGVGPPDESVGDLGDFYLDTDAEILYGPKVEGTGTTPTVPVHFTPARRADIDASRVVDDTPVMRSLTNADPYGGQYEKWMFIHVTGPGTIKIAVTDQSGFTGITNVMLFNTAGVLQGTYPDDRASSPSNNADFTYTSPVIAAGDWWIRFAMESYAITPDGVFTMAWVPGGTATIATYGITDPWGEWVQLGVPPEAPAAEFQPVSPSLLTFFMGE